MAAESSLYGPVSIDAGREGNETRFPNHSNDPDEINCEAGRKFSSITIESFWISE